MKDLIFPKQQKIHKKVLPALGGIKKGYIRKAHCLKKILQFLAIKIENTSKLLKIESNERKTFDEIKNDLLSISKYENENKGSFYFKCQSILNKY